MNTNVKVSLSNEQRTIIAKSLGVKGDLSREHVNALVDGLFLGLTDSAKVLAPTKKKPNKPVDKKRVAPVVSSALLEEWTAKRLKDGTITQAGVYGYRIGWAKESL